jgi:hypothetical protein
VPPHAASRRLDSAIAWTLGNIHLAAARHIHSNQLDIQHDADSFDAILSRK